MAAPPRKGRISRLLRLRPRDWLDLGRAVLELARARWRLGRIDIGQFRVPMPQAGEPVPVDPAQDALIDRVAWAVPRGAACVPWRSDCLVRAEAARHWLARQGVIAEIRLGARFCDDGRFDAHAWLLCAGRVVTGGDISGFTPFTSASSPVITPLETFRQDKTRTAP